MTKIIKGITFLLALFLISCSLNPNKNTEITSLNEVNDVLWSRICQNPDSVYLHLSGIEILITGELNDKYFSPLKISGNTDAFSFSVDKLSGFWQKDAYYYFLFYEDVDFDGFKDIGLLNNYGATGNYWYNIWIFNEKENKFLLDDYHTGMPSPIFDTLNKEIQVYYRMGACDETIAFIKNKIAVKRIYTENQNTKDGQQCWCITEQLIDSIWKETERKIINQSLDRIYRNEIPVIYGRLK